MQLDSRNLLRTFGIVVLLMGLTVSAAHAEDDDDDKRVAPAGNTVWQNECGACHVAFPPRLLSATSWNAVMSGLDKHFGNDASLDPAAAREIGAFLARHAGRSTQDSADKPLLRITETRWFKREHDEVSSRTWENPKVKSAANCAACHTKAESGNYSEHEIRIPK